MWPGQSLARRPCAAPAPAHRAARASVRRRTGGQKQVRVSFLPRGLRAIRSAESDEEVPVTVPSSADTAPCASASRPRGQLGWEEIADRVHDAVIAKRPSEAPVAQRAIHKRREKACAPAM